MRKFLIFELYDQVNWIIYRESFSLEFLTPITCQNVLLANSSLKSCVMGWNTLRYRIFVRVTVIEARQGLENSRREEKWRNGGWKARVRSLRVKSSEARKVQGSRSCSRAHFSTWPYLRFLSPLLLVSLVSCPIKLTTFVFEWPGIRSRNSNPKRPVQAGSFLQSSNRRAPRNLSKTPFCLAIDARDAHLRGRPTLFRSQ